MLQGRKIAIIESGNIHQKLPQDGYSNRVVALSPSSVALLQQLGSLDRIANDRKCPVKRMYVWDSESKGSISFDDDHPLATIVETGRVQQALVDEILALQDPITILNETLLLDVSRKDGKNMLTTGSSSITCDLLVHYC